MSEESEHDWLMKMSPNPHLTTGTPYSSPPVEADSQTSITYKERSILSPGAALWLEDEAQAKDKGEPVALRVAPSSPDSVRRLAANE
jgi:hypothetical protein